MVFRMFPLGKFVTAKHGFFLNVSYILKCRKKNFSSQKLFAQYKTMTEIREALVKKLDPDVLYSSEPKSKEHLLKYLPKSQAELPVRKMKQSYDAAIIPLSTDFQLRDRYTAFQGHVRLGRLMEDVDLFAVWCCTKHLSDPNAAESRPFPYIIVTIRVDEIEFINKVRQLTDIRISGHVCWVGTSSFEVIVWLDQEIDGKYERITQALLLMAARNSTNTGPGIINGIEAETEEEKELLKGGEKRKQKRMEMIKQSLLKKVPSEKELQFVHDLFIKTLDSKDVFHDKRVLPPKSKWMQDATLNNLVFCHPEYRNLHNKIFGGFLIRQALELSWSVGFIYGMRVPKLIHISDIAFYSPVDIGSLLRLYAGVTYTEGNFIQVFVYAEAYTTTDGEGKSTTSFNFTYDLGSPCDSLYPSTYLEAMKYIDGRRHFKNYLESRKL